MEARHAKQPGLNWSRLLLWLGVTTAIAGCLAVYTFVTHPGHKTPEVQVTSEASAEWPDKKTPETPVKVTPSISHSSPVPTVTIRSTPPARVTTAPPKPSPSRSSQPSSTPTYQPTPSATQSTAAPVPTHATTPTWTTSTAAELAAQRMDAAGVVGDPVCSAAGTGAINAPIPPGVTTVYTGQSGNYWCLIYA